MTQVNLSQPRQNFRNKESSRTKSLRLLLQVKVNKNTRETKTAAWWLGILFAIIMNTECAFHICNINLIDSMGST